MNPDSAMEQIEIEAHGHRVVLQVDPEDRIGRFVHRQQDFYERRLLDDMRGRMRAGLALDVGAHIGNHTVWLAAVCGLRVVAFEPNPTSRENLWVNIRANGLEDRVTVHPVALGAACGTGAIEIPNPANTGTARIVNGSGEIDVVPLDEIGLPESASVMKIDVEGYEMAVLQGAQRTIGRDRPVVYVETSEPEKVDDFLAPWRYERGACFARTPTWLFTPVDP